MSDKEYAFQQLASVLARINNASTAAKRKPADISLIGAAKQQSPEMVTSFIDAGLKDIGQNYLQEALAVKLAIASALPCWHYIGQIQSNKTASIATEFDWVHSVDRLKVARRLSTQRNSAKRLNILLQIDIDNEPSKGGAATGDVLDLVGQISELENTSLRGFMVLPRPKQLVDEQRKPFAKTRELLEQCNQRYGIHMDTLSMGMSSDLEAAILEGSTMVRIGTDLFGPRH